MQTRLFIRITFEPSGGALGPGMSELLERIEKFGSIRQAAISMHMSYRKAWLLLCDLQQTFGGPAVTTEIGGASGGGAQLTELGQKLLKTFRSIQRSVERATAADIQSLVALVQKDAKPRLKRKGLRSTVSPRQ